MQSLRILSKPYCIRWCGTRAILLLLSLWDIDELIRNVAPAPVRWDVRVRLLLLVAGVCVQVAGLLVPALNTPLFERRLQSVNANLALGAVALGRAAQGPDQPQRSLPTDLLLYVVHQDSLDGFLPQAFGILALYASCELYSAAGASLAASTGSIHGSGGGGGGDGAATPPARVLVVRLALLAALPLLARVYSTCVGGREVGGGMFGASAAAVAAAAASRRAGHAAAEKGVAAQRVSEGGYQQGMNGLLAGRGADSRYSLLLSGFWAKGMGRTWKHASQAGAAGASVEASAAGATDAAARRVVLSRAYGWRLAAAALLHAQALLAPVLARGHFGGGRVRMQQRQ